MLLLVTNFGFQGRVARRVVLMKEPVAVAPKFLSFSSQIFSQAFRNVTVRVKVRVDRSVRRTKFTVNIPFMLKKTMSMLFVELRTATPLLLLVIVGSSTAKIVALFLDHNQKSSFRHPL
jgi:hypothetical protein